MNTVTYANVTVLTPVGHVDFAAAPAFEQALIPYAQRCCDAAARLVIDLSEVGYMSSTGLRVLMLAAQRCRQQDTPLAVAGLQPTMREIFTISRFDRVFPIYPTVREALSALSAEALTAFDAASATH